jgi:hypothetical protein
MKAKIVTAKRGNFRNVNVALTRLNKRITNVAAQMPVTVPSIPVVPQSTRTLNAFAINTQVAGEKFNDNSPQVAEFDLRTVEINGKVYYPWLFSKTLKHDDMTGMTTKEDLDRLVCAIEADFSKEKIEALSDSRDPEAVRVLEGIHTGSSYWIKGQDTKQFTMDGFLQADSRSNICEMVEVYEKSLLRDVSLFDIQKENTPEVQRAIAAMNSYGADYTGPVNLSGQVTGKELFRGTGKDETVGPYTSQFLVHPYSLNGIHIEQKYPTEANVQATVDLTNFLDMQRGKITGPANKTGDTKYAYSGRVLGSYVHNDPMYFAYFTAAYMAYQKGFEMQHGGTDVTSAWTDQGAPDGLGSIADVALGALRVAWNSKWCKFLKLRPEAMAFRIDQILKGNLQGEMFDTIKDFLEPVASTLDAVKAQNGTDNYLLMSMYPEGSPTHPATPAGHAVLAGASTTVLKAFLKTHSEDFTPLLWPHDVQHSLTGDTLESYTEDDVTDVTVVGELNKLASNIALGRDFAGVHYRTDGDKGIKLGEKFAIKYLQCKLKEYMASYNKVGEGFFELETFAGEYIRITLDSVQVLHSR